MDRTEAAQVLAMLKAAYPNFYKGMGADEAQGTISVWSIQFADTAAEIVLMALNKVIATSKFPPTIAEIKEKISSLHWEAYEKLYMNYAAVDLPDDEERLYQRIYEATTAYKYNNRIEPTIEQMIGRDNTRLLSGG